MNSILKFSTIIFCLILFIVVANIKLADSYFWQSTILLAVILASGLKFGVNKLLTELKLLLPFIIVMLSVYFILGIFGFRISSSTLGNSTIRFWLDYGFIRILIFINTVFFIQLLMSYIKIGDILDLPLKMSVKRYFILGKALFSYTMHHLNDMEFHLRLMPEYQIIKLSFKQWFYLKLQLSYGIIIMMLRESHIEGELIDNRIFHCFPKDERSSQKRGNK